MAIRIVQTQQAEAHAKAYGSHACYRIYRNSIFEVVKVNAQTIRIDIRQASTRYTLHCTITSIAFSVMRV